MKKFAFIGLLSLLVISAFAFTSPPEDPVDYGIEDNTTIFSFSDNVHVPGFQFSKTTSEMELHVPAYITDTIKTTQEVIVVTQILVPDDATKPFLTEMYFLPGAG